MKTIFGIIASLFIISAVACTDDDRPITMEQLPAAAQQFVKANFAGMVVSYVMEDNDILDKSYTVMFDNGDKIEFNKNGEWKDIECKIGMVPESVIPAQLKAYIAKNHPTQKVTDLDRSRRHYEIKLVNGLELKFDKAFNLVEVDN